MLIKRYGMPLVLTGVLYTTVYLLFGRSAPYFGAELAVVLLQAYLIRTCDDLCDYQSDKQAHKAPISRPVLILLCCFLGMGALAVSLAFARYLLLLPPCLILVQLILPKGCRELIKPLFLPCMVITLVYEAFTPSAWVYAVAGVLLVADAMIILYKRRGERHDSGQ